MPFDLLWGRGDANALLSTSTAFTYLFRLFTVLGLNSPQAQTRFRRIGFFTYAAGVYVLQLAIVPACFILSYRLESNRMSMGQLLTSAQVAINACGLPAKVIAIALYMPRLRSATVLMQQLDARCALPKEWAAVRRAAVMGNRLQVCFSAAYIIYSTSTFLCSLVLGQPPYSLYIPLLDWRKSNAQFYAQAFIEYLLMNITCVNQSACDGYVVIYVYILRTHLQLLVERVRRLGYTDGPTEESNADANYTELVRCISDHQCLLDLLDIISPVISVTIFVQFLITAAILGITMINIFIFADTTSQIASVVYFLAVIVQTTPSCYQATCLIFDAEQLPLAIFHCQWMYQKSAFRKMLVFFMQRAQQPMILMAMKLFPINLATNLSIAKFSFSLYTLIKEMDFGQKLKN